MDEPESTKADVVGLRAGLLAFLREAYSALEAENIVPRPSHQPWMEVGVDYFGPTIFFRDSSNEGPEAAENASELLKAAYPHRFFDESKDLFDHERFLGGPDGMLLRILETAVALETTNQLEAAFELAVDEALLCLDADTDVVEAITIASGIDVVEPIQLTIGSNTVELSAAPGDDIWLAQVTEVARLEVANHQVFGIGPTHTSVLRARDELDWDLTASSKWASVSDSVESAHLLVRLARRTSSRRLVHARGSIFRTAHLGGPDLMRQPGSITEVAVRQDIDDHAVLSQGDVQSLHGFQECLVKTLGTDVQRADERATSSPLYEGLSDFVNSFNFGSTTTHFPMLSRVLEAWLLPDDLRDAVVLRLRLRACLLLESEETPAADISAIIKRSYGLRSAVEHAAVRKQSKINADLKAVADSDGDYHGVNERRAIENLRELARRAICARVLLAQCGEQLWPVDDTKDIDDRFLDAGFRTAVSEELKEQDERLKLGIFKPFGGPRPSFGR